MKKATTQSFIEKARAKHGDVYDYGLTVYTYAHNKVSIVCRVHGRFEQSATTHLSGAGCPACGGNSKGSTASFLERAHKLHGKRYDYSRAVYTGSDNKLVIICPVHGEFLQAAKKHLIGQGCPDCGNPQVTTEMFISDSRAKHGEKYDYSLCDYTGANRKVVISCPRHGNFSQTPANHLKGLGCAKCVNESRKGDTERFIEKARLVHGNRYDYSQAAYSGAHGKVQIACTKHGVFSQSATGHLSGAGCPECWKENRRAYTAGRANKKAKTFVEDARAVHGDIYDYSGVAYKNSMTKVSIVCRLHGLFAQTPASHVLKGAGCPKCGDITTAEKKRLPLEDFLQEARRAHSNRYIYDTSDYRDRRSFIAIQCPTHGSFRQSASNHLQGQGCPKCAATERGLQKTERKKSTILQDFMRVHGDKYSYREVNYTRSNVKVSVICNTHGVFKVTPANHLSGHGCPECWKEDRPQYIDARIKNDPEFAKRLGVLYLLKVSHPSRATPFYKIGITSLGGVDGRFRRFAGRYSNFDVTVIESLEMSMHQAWNLEQKIKRSLKARKMIIKKFTDDYWHWSESFESSEEPSVKGLCLDAQ